MRGAELAVEVAAAEGRGAVEAADLVGGRAADLEEVDSEAESVADSAAPEVVLAAESAGDSVAPVVALAAEIVADSVDPEGLAVDSAIAVVPVAADSVDQVRADLAGQAQADSIAAGNSIAVARVDSLRRAATSWTAS